MTPDFDRAGAEIVVCRASYAGGGAGTRRASRGGLRKWLCGALVKVSRQEKRG